MHSVWRGAHELMTLEKRLIPGEVVERLGPARSGGKSGLFALTDHRLLILYDGVIKRHTDELSLGTTTSVNVKPGLMFARIDIVAASVRLEADSVPKQDPEALVNRIRQRMNGTVPAPAGTYPQAAATTPLTKTPTTSTPTVDVTHQLSRLADLRDRGVLTDAEFAAQKGASSGCCTSRRGCVPRRSPHATGRRQAGGTGLGGRTA